MHKVVYVLGAGFSEPLGLPLMTNFIEKSKDIFYEDKTDKYKYFNDIYELIDKMGSLKSYINCDLFNIEEILSLLEMEYYIGNNKKDLEDYKKFIKDVIEFYTPVLIPNERNRDIGNWNDFCFGDAKIYRRYGIFLSYLLQIKIFKNRGVKIENAKTQTYIEPSYNENHKDTEYSIITLNYDRVIENIIDFIKKNHNDTNEKSEFLNTFKLIKLHGCISTDIILPTWNKKYTELVFSTWEEAYKELSSANSIRIIGYSLPISDNYIRYLFSIALRYSKHLKNIDVIALDKNGETKKRYESFFSFPNFNFKDKNFSDFLYDLDTSNRLPINKSSGSTLENITFLSSFLEAKHKEFFRSNS
ncbi:MAG: SIR2 family protein [Actinobacteria bacterium]|nr:SIR2 family protein [Actinomycetota bacterium]